MRRWVFFILSILIGIAIGLLYGWVIQPVQYTNTTLKSLGTEYKTDYVLMVAEAFNFDQDAAAAVNRLAKLNPPGTLDEIHQAILYAEEAGYNSRDLQLLRLLQSAMMPILPVSTP
jgi:hypothetical protein